MRVTHLQLSALVAVVALSSCSQLGRRSGSGPRGLPSPGEIQSPGSLPSVGTPSPTPRTAVTATRKRVAEKEEPSTLVASDRTRCAVTANRFRDTQVGDDAICDWRTGDRAP